MKVALCISGQFRTAMELVPNLKDKILNPLLPDIFMLCQDGDASTLKTYKSMFKGYSIKKLKSVPAPEIDVTKYDAARKADESKVYDVLAQFKLLFDCFDLIADPTEYDVIIRTRFDNYYKRAFTDNELNLLNQEDKKFILVPAEQDWRNGVNDRFAIGNTEPMKEYFDLYNRIEDMVYKQGVLFHPETLMRSNIEKLGLIRIPPMTEIISEVGEDYLQIKAGQIIMRDF